MEMSGAAAFADSCEPRTQVFIRRGAIKKRQAQGAQIEAGATNEQSRMTTTFNLSDLFNCSPRPISSCEIYQWRDEVDQMMRYATTLCEGHLCRRYLNAMIDLDRVAVNDLAADASRKLDSQLALSGSGGTHNGNDARSADILSAFFAF